MIQQLYILDCNEAFWQFL